MIIYVMMNGHLASHYIRGFSSIGSVELSDEIDDVDVWLHQPSEQWEELKKNHAEKVLRQTLVLTWQEARCLATWLSSWGLSDDGGGCPIYCMVIVQNDDGTDTPETVARQRRARGEI